MELSDRLSDIAVDIGGDGISDCQVGKMPLVFVCLPARVRNYTMFLSNYAAFASKFFQIFFRFFVAIPLIQSVDVSE